MNILIIDHYAGSPRDGMEFRPYYLAREWQRLGHATAIVAASYSHVRAVNPKVTFGYQVESIDGLTYVWLRTPRYVGNGFRRAFNICIFGWQVGRYWKRLLDEFSPNVVIASSTHPLDVPGAWWLSRRARARFVFEIHDLWPLSVVELGGLSRYNPFVVLMQWAADFGCRRADSVVSLLPLAATYLRSRGMKEGCFSYIPNGIDCAEWGLDSGTLPAVHVAAVEGERSRGKFLVGYAGAHGIANALGNLIECAELMAGDDVHFLLVGEGPEKRGLEERAFARGLENVTFLPRVQKRAVPELLRLMDALFLGVQRQPLYRFGVSLNKLFDYMMAARPILQAIDAGNDAVSDAACGITVSPEDPVALARAIRKLMEMSAAERQKMGTRGREYAERNHDYRVLADRFLQAVLG